MKLLKLHRTMETHSEGSIGSNGDHNKVPLLASRYQQLHLLPDSRIQFKVHGISMLPTLNCAGEVLLVEHVSPRIGKVGPGDLVLVRSRVDPNRSLIKRIVGMEGQTVTYFDPRHGDRTHVAVVPKGHVWIQGDNIYGSRDSRHFGPVPYGLIQGKAFLRVSSNYTLSIFSIKFVSLGLRFSQFHIAISFSYLLGIELSTERNNV